MMSLMTVELKKNKQIFNIYFIVIQKSSGRFLQSLCPIVSVVSKARQEYTAGCQRRLVKKMELINAWGGGEREFENEV